MAFAGLVWIISLGLWAGGSLGPSFAFFLGVLGSAAAATAGTLRVVMAHKEPTRGLRGAIVVVLAVSVPIVFDPHTSDVFNLPKYSLVVIGALVIGGLWIVGAVKERSTPWWRNGLQWVVLAVVVWTGITAAFSINPRLSILGRYGSYDGLYAAIAFATILMAASESFQPRELRSVLGLYGFAGGGPVVFYGLLQLHDMEFPGSKPWDFIHWNAASVVGNIFSTFGNPNHLGGYLAMILPIVLVLALTARSLTKKVAGCLFGCLVLVEILRTVARGAWVAVIAAMVVLAIALAPELRKKPWVTLGTTGGVVVLAAFGMAIKGHRFIAQPLSSLFQSGGLSSVGQRFQLWSIAGRIAEHHPIVGTGPDTYAVLFPQHQSPSWVAALGPNYIANGAHNMFMNALSDQGFVGLGILLALLAAIGLRSVGAWRRLRRMERNDAGNDDAVAAREQRLLLAAVSASIVAYVVQACFNVQQIGLSFGFWFAVGVSGVTCRFAQVPDTLVPRRLVSIGDVELKAAEEVSVARGTPRLGSARRSRQVSPWLVALVSTAVAVAVAFLALGADGPYRADHAYWASYRILQQPRTTANATTLSSEYFAMINHAEALNPWEPTYPYSEGNVLAQAASQIAKPADAASVLRLAHQQFARAIALQPNEAEYWDAEAKTETELAKAAPRRRMHHLEEALLAAQRALADNPLDSTYRANLNEVKAATR